MIRTAPSEDASELAWFKSSHSSGPDGESCVEIATGPRTVHARDSKVTDGPSLAFTPTTWAAFVPYASEG
ncbi:toxin [Streptomyces fumigatiscleroticus]|nr:toxin [Streptomyces fumigatiscleroticus]